MANAEIIATEGTRSQSGEYLIRRLPPWMPRYPGSGNFKLLDVTGHGIDRVENDLADLDTASSVHTADTIPQLSQLAKLVDLPPRENEPVEKYRTRVIAEFQTMTTEGTPQDVIENTATLLDVDPTKIGYEELDENGVVSIHVPGKALDNLNLSDDEFIAIVGKHVAAGYRIQATISGTFTFLAEADYTGPYDSVNGGYDPASLTSDPALGHDGLDANGDPKGNGGTYAGVIT